MSGAGVDPATWAGAFDCARCARARLPAIEFSKKALQRMRVRRARDVQGVRRRRGRARARARDGARSRRRRRRGRDVRGVRDDETGARVFKDAAARGRAAVRAVRRRGGERRRGERRRGAGDVVGARAHRRREGRGDARGSRASDESGGGGGDGVEGEVRRRRAGTRTRARTVESELRARPGRAEVSAARCE